MNRDAAPVRECADLAVIIPAWNVRENLEVLLPALREVIADLGVTAEIVVVDGCPTTGRPRRLLNSCQPR